MNNLLKDWPEIDWDYAIGTIVDTVTAENIAQFFSTPTEDYDLLEMLMSV